MNDGDKVLAYCIGTRGLGTLTTAAGANIDNQDIAAADAAGASGIVTLQGASALVTAAAIAFGAVAITI